MPITISLPLDLPDVRVLATRVLPDATLLIEVERTLRTAQCHRCGREIDRVHGFDRPIRLRHLPVFGREVLIEICPKRYLRQAEGQRPNAERHPEQAVPTAELRPLLRRAWQSLNPDQQGQVVERFEQTPTLASAYVPHTLLTAIFDHSPDRATAQTRLQRWTEQVKASGLSCFDKFINTLHNWQDSILNYFEGRHNSGFVEGLNNKLKLLKRRCFGLDDPVELFRRLWLDLEGPQLWT